MPVDLKLVKQELAIFRKDYTKYPRLQVLSLDTVPAPGINALTFKGVVHGESGTDYLSYIQFFDVLYKDTPETPEYTETTTVGGKLKFYKKPNIKYNLVKLKCSCQDWRFRGEREAFDNQGLIGNWRRYSRVTPPPPNGYPYANPKGLMMYCKHIHSLLVSLKASNRIDD